jgi:hypothetical protein
MLDTSKTDVFRLIKEHFSKATDGDGPLVWDSVKGLDYRDAERAIKEHRREKGAQAWRPDINRISFLAHTYHRDRQHSKFKTERIVDAVRRYALNHGDTRFEVKAYATDRDQLQDDVRVLMVHFTDSWAQVQASELATPFGKQGARAYLLNHARRAFTEIGMSERDVEEYARNCVGLEPGEVLNLRSVFKGYDEVNEPPMSHEAIKALQALGLTSEGEAAA